MVEGKGTVLDYGRGRKLAESVFKKDGTSEFKLSSSDTDPDTSDLLNSQPQARSPEND